MEWAREQHPAERAVDVAASAILAGAIAFAVRSAALEFDSGLAPAMATAVVAGVAFLVVYAGLRRLDAYHSDYPLETFDLAPIEAAPEDRAPVGELWLTAEMALCPRGADDVLLLEDRLTDIDADARVVRLFDPRQLYETVVHPPSAARQPRPSRRRIAPSDASQALSDALAELRRALH